MPKEFFPCYTRLFQNRRQSSFRVILQGDWEQWFDAGQVYLDFSMIKK